MKVQEELVLISYLRKQLQAMMSELVGIVRSDNRLQIAQNRINEIEKMVKEIYYFTIVSPKILELRNLVDVAHLIIEQSINQKENRGTFTTKILINEEVISVRYMFCNEFFFCSKFERKTERKFDFW